MNFKDSKLMKNRWLRICLGIILYFIILGSSFVAAGVITILGCIGYGIYLFRNESFKQKNKIIRGIIYTGLTFVILFGAMLTSMTPESVERSRVAAEKARIEKQQVAQAKKESEEKAKKEADEKAKKQAEEVAKKAEEAKKIEAEAKKKADEEAAKKAEEEKAKAIAQSNNSEQASTASQQNSNTESNSSNQQVANNTERQTSGEFIITNKGKKYHRSGCRTVKQVNSTVSREQAESMGYSPCGVCHP